VSLVDGLTGVQKCYSGVPASIGVQISAYVAMSGSVVTTKPSATIRRDMRFVVVFGFRIAGAELNAEEQLADIMDAATRMFMGNRRLDGVCENIELDFTLSENPEYQTLAGQEYRLMPIAIIVSEYEAYNVIQP
jgi:hypothetical protein